MERAYLVRQQSLLGVAKVLQSEKNAMEILDVMDIETPEKCKNPTKTYEMEVLEAMENETLESNSSVFR
jgi:hypothetical protein